MSGKRHWSERSRECADLNLCHLAVKVPRHQPLAEQLHAVHFCFDPAAAVMPAPVPPERPAQVLRCSQDLVARPGTGCVRLPWPGIPSRRNDGCSGARGDGVVAGAGVIGVASGARTGGASAGNSAVTVAISSSPGIWASRSGSIPRRFARTGGAHRLDIADIAGRDLDGPDFQCFLVDSEVNLAP